MNFLTMVRDWLARLDPAAPAAGLIVFVFFVIYAIRRWRPTWWLWLERKLPIVDEFNYTFVGNLLWNSLQALPAVLLGAVTSAIADGVSLKGALVGAALGAATALIHKLAAGYKGKVGGPRAPDFPGALVLLFIVGLCLSQNACTSGLTPRTIDQAAIILCDTFFREHPKVGISPNDVEQALCSTADQIEPFLASAKSASERGGAVRMKRAEGDQ